AGFPVLRAAVDVDLRARPGRSAGAGGPVVVLHPAALDAFVGQAGDLLPQASCVVVGLENGHPHVVGAEAEAPILLACGDELPRVADRAFLEVVPEREVSVHLEEGAVPGGL